MAFDLSTPAAKLAFDMALRNKQAIDASPQYDTEARAAVSKALQYGNDPLSGYEDIYRSYMDPAENQRRAQAQAFNDYLVGLPELLAKSRTEGSSGGGGGSAATGTGMLSGYRDPFERLNALVSNIVEKAKPTQRNVYSTTRFADAEERRANNARRMR